MNIDVSAQQLRRAAELKERIEELQSELAKLLGSTTRSAEFRGGGMSAAGRARIAAAQRARWAKARAGVNGASRKSKRRMSAAVKARLSAIAKARWKKAKAAGKKAL